MLTNQNKKELFVLKNYEPLLFNALVYHRTFKNQQLEFTKHKYLLDIYKDKSDYLVLKKSSQSGISEWLIIYAISEANQGRVVLYVLPSFDLKNDFVKTRFDGSVGYTKYYQSLIENASENKKASESISIKNFGVGTIIFAGTHSMRGAISHPGDTLIVDEEDQCNEEILPFFESRLSHSEHKKHLYVSNPKFNGKGIDAHYNKSDKKQWHIKHDCGHWIVPDFYKHVWREIDSTTFVIRDQEYNPTEGKFHINSICDKCGKPFDRYANGEWISQSKSEISGYHINKLFSSFDSLSEIVSRFNEALSNQTKMQAVYNMDLGLGYTPTGSSITADMLDKCKRDYLMPDQSQKVTIAGIDVGNINNVLIAEIETMRIVGAYEVRDAIDIMDLIKRYNVKCFVIDAAPEPRFSRQFVVSFSGGFMNHYVNGRVVLQATADKLCSLDRTVAIDNVKEYVLTEQILLPKNWKEINNFESQMTSSVRVYDEKKDKYDWVESGPDHFLHAAAYLIMAKKLLTSIR